MQNNIKFFLTAALICALPLAVFAFDDGGVSKKLTETLTQKQQQPRQITDNTRVVSPKAFLEEYATALPLFLVFNGAKLEKNSAVKQEKFTAALSSAIQNNNIITKNINFGEVIDLASIKGKGFVGIIPLEGKTFEPRAEALVFAIQYSKYSYVYSAAQQKDSLLVAFLPIEQAEDLYPKTSAKVGLNDSSVIVETRAVTVDDFNNGMGWGEVNSLGKFK